MNNSHRYLFLGDSVTDCGRSRDIRQPNLPGALGNGWVNRVATDLLSKEPDAQVWNRGYSGCRIAQLLGQPHWLPLRTKAQPAFREITLLIGINDIWHPFNEGVPHGLADTKTAFKALLEELSPLTDQLTVIEPFAIEGPAVNERWWPLLNEMCEQQCQAVEAVGARWLPTREALTEASRSRPELWLYDGVHPGVLGHKWLAERWLGR